MYIPTLASKNKQYKEKFCNVLNNKPEFNIEIFESGSKKTNNGNDRHLFTKSLLTSEKVCHKPPKAVRRHSSKIKKTKTSYEYVKKEDFYKNCSKNNKTKDVLNNCTNQDLVTDTNTIELNYKEKFIEKDLETSNHKEQNIFNELYDSLDKRMLNSKMEFDSLEVNLNTRDTDQKLYDSLEVNVWSKNSGVSKNTAFQLENVLKKPGSPCKNDKIAFALENIKILNEIQKKIHKINNLVDVFKKNITTGKKAKLEFAQFRREEVELAKVDNKNANDRNTVEAAKHDDSPLKSEVYLDESSPDSSLRRSCSLSDLSMQLPAVSKRKIDQGKKPTNTIRNNSRYIKNNSITRSRSSGVLNQSDSDPETQEKKVSRLMRPTISSHNKINNKSLQNRKKHSYSTSNINTIGITDNISTSDDDLPTPTAPPRSRNYDNGQPAITPRRHLNNKEKSRASRHTIHFDDTLTNEDIDSNESMSSVEKTNPLHFTVSNQLCDDLIDQLTTTAEKVVKLYDRLNESDDTNESQIEKIDRVKMSMIRTHKVLHDCIFRELKQNNGGIDINQTDTVKKLNDLVSKGPTGPNSVINIMEQYSDILLDMVQQKIHNANI
ncbi:hypothetical protein NQ317_008218 [Molorchus minor]|uniref:Uncharacterized protein n=1 Tax=Molorchus minor TaxID=1323400 RepID=A0ABQ9JU85_9CUCU|nr:hypothetical protein NQ317_008218 [Molorchus minor]